MSTRTNLIAALLHMLNKPIPPHRLDYGVCGNLYVVCNRGLGLNHGAARNVSYLFETDAMRLRLYSNWPLWSGRKAYPVPHHAYLPTRQATVCNYEQRVYGAADSAYHHLAKWTGAQLHLRRDFLYHCVKQLRKMTDDEVEAML